MPRATGLSTAALDAKGKPEIRRMAKEFGVDSDTATKAQLIKAIQSKSK